MTWGSCGGGGSAWDSLTSPVTSNLSLTMGLFTTTFTYGDQGASAAIPLLTVTDSASTSSDRSLNIVADTGGSSNHIPFSARYRGSDTIKVCPAVGSVTGVAVVGAIIACETINSVNATPIAKFLVESATNAHTTARFYQNGAAQTGNGVEIFTKTAAGTGFNSFLVKTGCTDGGRHGSVHDSWRRLDDGQQHSLSNNVHFNSQYRDCSFHGKQHDERR